MGCLNWSSVGKNASVLFAVLMIRSNVILCSTAQSLSAVTRKLLAPKFFASASLVRKPETTQVSAPNALENRTLKCPMPPRPTIPTPVRGPTPLRIRGESAVRLVQSIGADLALFNSSGKGNTLAYHWQFFV